MAVGSDVTTVASRATATSAVPARPRCLSKAFSFIVRIFQTFLCLFTLSHKVTLAVGQPLDPPSAPAEGSLQGAHLRWILDTALPSRALGVARGRGPFGCTSLHRDESGWRIATREPTEWLEGVRDFEIFSP